MDQEKFEKALKNARAVALFLLALVIILFIFRIAMNQITTIQIISIVIQLILLIATALGMKKRALYGPICGIIVSILMILALDLVDIIIGICYLIDNIKIIKYMNNS